MKTFKKTDKEAEGFIPFHNLELYYKCGLDRGEVDGFEILLDENFIYPIRTEIFTPEAQKEMEAQIQADVI